jgi:plastocyanin
MRKKIAAATLAVGALALVPATMAGAGAGAAKSKVIKIGDNFFAPDSAKVAKGTKVVWRWPKDAGDTHDVKLRSGPKGVKKFHSEYAASDYSFARTLKKPGKYVLVCTLHEGMKMTIRVKS